MQHWLRPSVMCWFDYMTGRSHFSTPVVLAPVSTELCDVVSDGLLARDLHFWKETVSWSQTRTSYFCQIDITGVLWVKVTLNWKQFQIIFFLTLYICSYTCLEWKITKKTTPYRPTFSDTAKPKYGVIIWKTVKPSTFLRIGYHVILALEVPIKHEKQPHYWLE